MQHWVIPAIRGSKDNHEEIIPFGESGSKINLWIVIRLLHLLSENSNKENQLQIGFFNPTGRTFSLTISWKLNELSGKKSYIVKAANGFRAITCDCILSHIVVEQGVQVNGIIKVSEKKRSVHCSTECNH
jgi:hypothetical protein